MNNASALYKSSIEDTPTKTFDLVMDINSRGTFLCSKYCIPYLKKSSNPHILTLSPPLDMGSKANWFANMGTGYVVAKYNMTLISHGLSGELEDYGIGCNTIWPRTVVASGVINRVGDQYLKLLRVPEIMSDAAHVILTSDSRKTNG